MLLSLLVVGCRSETIDKPAAKATSPAPRSSDIESAALQPLARASGATTLFELLPAERTGVDFQMQVPDIEKNVRPIIHLNVNGGVCTGDYDDDGLADFYITTPRGGNRLYRNLGDFRFEDVTERARLNDAEFWGTGATFVDIENDGDLDLYACGYLQPNRLYVNQGRGPEGSVYFEEQASERGLAFEGASMTMAFADMDNDGDLDGYLATTAKQPPPGTKFQVRFEGRKPVVLDRLQEYWQLLYLPDDRAHLTESGQFDRLYRNDGGRFTEVTKEAGITGPFFTLSATWWDYNADGFADIYVANDFMGPDRLYHNNGDGTFADVAADVLPHTPWFSMGTDLADVNNDSLIDFLATDMSSRTHYRDKVMTGNIEETTWFLEYGKPRQYMRNALFLNSGAGRMMEAAHLANVASTDWTWNPRFADFDNDGRMDLFVTNGVTRDTMNSDLAEYAKSNFGEGSPEWAKFWAEQEMYKEANVALRNAGDLKFEDAAAAWGLGRVGVSFAAATADFDNDGDLDLVVNNADVPASVYRNQSDQGSRVRIRLVGKGSNRFGIGATIRLEAGGLKQTSYLASARGWLSSNEPVTTFGLGKAQTIDRLHVIWPSGHLQTFSNLPADRLYTIREPTTTPSRNPQASKHANNEVTTAADTLFVPADHFVDIHLQEAPFDDFAVQPLLPNRLSTQGPAMAWADIDADGDQDFYVGGPRDQPGKLFVDTGGGWYNLRPVPDFDKDQTSEDTAAAFFDADGDADMDLYVVSGSVEHPAGDEAYRDRLYINDGAHAFKRAPPETLPDLRDSGSSVAPADFDGDGDIDLFVGSRSIPGQYPRSAENRLLVNNGGRFTDEAPDALRQAGMVTDASWVDVDGDERPDLIVTTDWGPIRIFANRDGELVESTAEAGLANRLGWWKAVAAGDLDGDGDNDLVVTKIGLNTKYRADAASPEVLFYGDVDGSGVMQIVEARRENGTLYPRRGFRAAQAAMPMLKEKFKSFHEYAKASLAEIYTEERLQAAERLEVNTLESGLAVNDGKGRFEFRPLPRLAQIAPSSDIEVVDLTGDGKLDIVMAQNLYGAQPETGHMDGGLGLVLVGSGNCEFQPLWPNRSGIVVPGDARAVHAVDLNGDGARDLVFAINNGAWQAFYRRTSGESSVATSNQPSVTRPTK